MSDNEATPAEQSRIDKIIAAEIPSTGLLILRYRALSGDTPVTLYSRPCANYGKDAAGRNLCAACVYYFDPE
jgi:hypothetical protein